MTIKGTGALIAALSHFPWAREEEKKNLFRPILLCISSSGPSLKRARRKDFSAMSTNPGADLPKKPALLLIHEQAES
jgi:hypothetical protein